MKEFETGAIRDTGGKGRMDLLPMCALLRVSKHMENSITPDLTTGISHYPERNWENGLPMHSMLDSAMRHLVKYMDGWTDEDHLCAATTNLLMAMWTEEKIPEMQDIPSRIDCEHIGLEGQMSMLKRSVVGVVRDDSVEVHKSQCDYFADGRCCGTKEYDPCMYNGDYTRCTYGRASEYPAPTVTCSGCPCGEP
jgi:hypothetical protein